MLRQKILLGTDNLEEAFKIRRRVFIEEQGVPEEFELDEYDKVAEHAIIFSDRVSVATGRLFKKNNQYLIGRVAVLKEFRGQLFGVAVMNVLIDRARAIGANEVHIHAQKSAQEFYKMLGFVAYGDDYEEAGIEHVNMKLILICKKKQES